MSELTPETKRNLNLEFKMEPFEEAARELATKGWTACSINVSVGQWHWFSDKEPRE